MGLRFDFECRLIENQIPKFTDWLKNKFNTPNLHGHLTMEGCLASFGYFEKKASNKEDINKMLGKFYFLGLTKYLKDDSLYLYDKLGIHKYFIDQNILE